MGDRLGIPGAVGFFIFHFYVLAILSNHDTVAVSFAGLATSNHCRVYVCGPEADGFVKADTHKYPGQGVVPT